MNKENRSDTDSDLLFKIYENLIRTEERLKALSELNKTEHQEIRDDVTKACTKQEELEKRVLELEKHKFALSWTWKIIIFFIGLIPTVIAILATLNII